MALTGSRFLVIAQTRGMIMRVSSVAIILACLTVGALLPSARVFAQESGQRFTLRCTSNEGRKRAMRILTLAFFISVATLSLPVFGDEKKFTLHCSFETWNFRPTGHREQDLSFIISGTHGRYFDFQSETWGDLDLVSSTELVISSFGSRGSSTRTINRTNGRLFTQIRREGDNLVVYTEDGSCQKVPWEAPPSAKF